MAVIFDLEGTLLSTRECRIRAWNQTAKEQGIHLDDKMLQKIAQSRPQQALETMLTRSRRVYHPAEKLALMARLNDLLDEALDEAGDQLLLPDGEALVMHYRSQGLKTAAVSTVSDADSLLRRLRMRSLFDLTAQEFAMAADLLHMSCNACIAVSANEETLQEAARLGMQCVPQADAAAQLVFYKDDKTTGGKHA